MKQKDPAAVALGRRGGLARAKKLTAAERRAIAVRAITVRWAKAKNQVKREDMTMNNRTTGGS